MKFHGEAGPRANSAVVVETVVPFDVDREGRFRLFDVDLKETDVVVEPTVAYSVDRSSYSLASGSASFACQGPLNHQPSAAVVQRGLNVGLPNEGQCLVRNCFECSWSADPL